MRYIKLLLPVTLLLAACGSKPAKPALGAAEAPKKISIATYTWVGYAPLYLAENKGFFSKRGIQVTLRKIDDTAARRAALASGGVQASVNTVDAFSNVIGAGIRAKVVLKMDDSLGGDGIVVNKEISTVAGLAGKAIAYPPGQPSHYFLYKLLEKHGLSMADITNTPMEADQAGVAFIAKRVEAAVTWEPWLTNAKNSQHGMLLASTADVPVIVDVLTVRSDYLAKNPDVIKAVCEAWMEAVAFWKASPEESNRIMGDAMDIPAEEFQLMIKGCKYADLAENKRYFTRDEDGKSDYTRLLDDANAVWKEQGLITNPVDPKEADGTEILLSLQ